MYKRQAIIKAFSVGRSPTKIVPLFGYPRSTFYDIVQKYAYAEKSEEGSANPARQRRLGERTARTPAVIQRAQHLISEFLGVSLCKVSTTLRVSEAYIRQIVEKPLRYTSYEREVTNVI